MVLDCASDYLWCRSVHWPCAAHIRYGLERCRVGAYFRVACDSGLYRCRARGRKLGKVEQVVSRRCFGIAYMGVPCNGIRPSSLTVELICTVGETSRLHSLTLVLGERRAQAGENDGLQQLSFDGAPRIRRGLTCMRLWPHGPANGIRDSRACDPSCH
jgi:hypothetical protein